jgi:hypothetical protein
MSTGHRGDYGNAIMQKPGFFASAGRSAAQRPTMVARCATCAGTIAIVAESGDR